MSRTARRHAVAALVALVAFGATASCSSDPKPASETLRASGWIPLTDARSVVAVTQSQLGPLFVVHTDGGAGPTLAEVVDSELTEVGHVPAAPTGGRTAVDGNGSLIAAAVAGTGAKAAWLRVWQEDPLGEQAPYASGDAPRVPRDTHGRPASTVWPLLDGEDEFSAAGVVRTGGRDVIHAWEEFEDWEIFDDHDQLLVTAGPAASTVHAAATITTVVVAGAVGDRRTAHPTPQVWSIADLRDESHGRWTRERMATTPDAITDLAAWDLGWWVAGTRGNRPVVDGYDSSGSGALPVPDTTLDPDRPTVLIAGVPILEPMTLATQSADGPTVWTRSGSTWTRTAAPEGTLTAARRIKDDVYVVVDGRLWLRKLPLPPSASASATPTGSR